MVALYANIEPYAVILSPTSTTDMKAIIDWEFVASVPCALLHRVIKMLFKKSAPNGFGAKYAYGDELCDAFWGAISE